MNSHSQPQPHLWHGKSICVAPMLKVTTPHYLKLLSILSSHAHLYSEMIIANALIHNTQRPCFAFEPIKNPLTLQIAGSNPSHLQKAISIANHHDSYNEYNLNVGCPSKRANAGLFGVSLMEHPHTVASCLRAMKDATDRKITLKCRYGINQDDNGETLRRLIDAVLAQNACDTLILHARIAIMKFKPKDNWSIPPLNYEAALQIKREYPELPLILNGGISSLHHAQDYIHSLDGVMIGRAFENQPALVSHVDTTLHPHSTTPIDIHEAVRLYIEYAERIITLHPDTHPHGLFLPLMHLFHKEKGARQWRVTIGEALKKHNTSLEKSLDLIKKILDIRLSLPEDPQPARREELHPALS